MPLLTKGISTMKPTTTRTCCLNALIVFCVSIFGGTAYGQSQLVVTVGTGTPAPNPVATGQATSTTFNIALSAPQNIHRELERHGAFQEYTIQLANSSGTSEGNPVSITIAGSTLKNNGLIGDFEVTFDRPNSRITLQSRRLTGLLSTLSVSASFDLPGVKRINLDGLAIIDGTTYDDNDGGRAEVTVIDFHIRANTNGDGFVNAGDDATADNPGLFVCLNYDDDNGNSTADRTDTSQVAGEDEMKLALMVLDPLPPSSGTGSDYLRCVKISRSNTNIRVWRTSDKSGWNNLGGQILVEDLSNTWDLTNSDSRSRFEHDRNSLYIEGYDPGATTLTLDLIDNSFRVVLSDTLVVNAWGVELQVNNTDTTDDDIVCRRATSPAGRPEIPCKVRLVGGAPAMTVYLDNGGGQGSGQLRFGTQAGSVTAENLTLSLAAGSGNNPGAASNFRISGETESTAMRDAVIRVKQTDASGPQVGQTTSTVLWVTLSWRHEATEDVSNDNSARMMYAFFYNQYSMGLCHGLTDGRIGWGFEVKGDVKPADFANSVILGRDVQLRWYMDHNNGSTPVNGAVFEDGRGYWDTNFSGALPGNDVSGRDMRDDTPRCIYDLDAPGLYAGGLNRPQNTIQRFRGNFRQYSYYDYDGVPATTNDMVRCSDNFEFWFRMSYRQNGAGVADQWQPVNDINNDNRSGTGTTGINWNSAN
jgi:hypothetical protein